MKACVTHTASVCVDEILVRFNWRKPNEKEREREKEVWYEGRKEEAKLYRHVMRPCQPCFQTWSLFACRSFSYARRFSLFLSLLSQLLLVFFASFASLTPTLYACLRFFSNTFSLSLSQSNLILSQRWRFRRWIWTKTRLEQRVSERVKDASKTNE